MVVKSSGTQTVTLGVEHTLATETDDATYVLLVDANELSPGEELELSIRTKILSGGTTRDLFRRVYNGETMTDPILMSLAVPSDQEIVFTLKQTGGTARDYAWKTVAL